MCMHVKSGIALLFGQPFPFDVDLMMYYYSLMFKVNTAI